MRKLALMLAQCLLLAGCTGLPRPREMGDMALVRTVGVDPEETGIHLTVSTGERAKGVQGEKDSALVLETEGESLSAAALTLGSRSDSYVFFGYVEQLLLGEEIRELNDVLGWFAHDAQLGLGAKVWLVRDLSAGEAVKSGEQAGVERRLAALSRDGELGAAPLSRSAGEVAISLLERGCAFLPALKLEEELTPAGYAVWKGESLLGYLEGEAARGLELLAEEPAAYIIEVALPDNRVSLRLNGAQLDCRPRFDGERLEKLELTARCEVQLCQWQREPTAREMEEIQRRAEEVLSGWIHSAMVRLRAWEADCVALGSRVSLAAPWHWENLEPQWQEVFGRTPWTLDVAAALSR